MRRLFSTGPRLNTLTISFTMAFFSHSFTIRVNPIGASNLVANSLQSYRNKCWCNTKFFNPSLDQRAKRRDCRGEIAVRPSCFVCAVGYTLKVWICSCYVTTNLWLAIICAMNHAHYRARASPGDGTNCGR